MIANPCKECFMSPAPSKGIPCKFGCYEHLEYIASKWNREDMPRRIEKVKERLERKPE